jgi:hypothetical protein
MRASRDKQPPSQNIESKNSGRPLERRPDFGKSSGEEGELIVRRVSRPYNDGGVALAVPVEVGA